MDQTLPRPVRLRLEQALAQWRQWQSPPRHMPELVAVLAEGISNTSLRVGDGSSDWVIRIDGFAPARLGLSRQAERSALKAAADAGLAPPPVYHNPEVGVLVCEYLPPDPGDRASPEQLGELLRRVQALPPIRYRLDPLQRARLYMHHAGMDALPSTLVEAAEELARTPVRLSLCHNDLLRANRIQSGGRLYAVDWEYAAMGDPWFDLAVIVEGDSMGDAEIDALHRAWLEREPTAAELHRLALQRTVYRELTRLWELAVPHCAPG